MGYSVKLKIDKYYPRKDGTAAVFLQVIINRKKERIGLDFTWPIKKFSEVKGCLPRMKADPDVETYNIVIGNATTKTNNIRKEYLIKGWNLTLDAFIRDYNSDLNKNNFIQYIEKKSHDRWKDREIDDSTYRKEKGVVNKLRELSESIPFHEFNSKWAFTFDKHLKTKYKNDDNTRWGNHKIMITYLNLARDQDKINFENPYSRFTNRLVESSWGPLTLDQMLLLIKFYMEWRNNPLPLLPRKNGGKQVDHRPGLTKAEVRVLRKFLFACNTALRISDLQELDEAQFSNGEMSITPHKTERYGTNIKSVMINDVARLMLDEEIADVKTERAHKPSLRIFENYIDQYCNRLLKRIATKTGLNIRLHMHMARYTFGSLMDQAGANHTAVMKMMGIIKRSTFDKYTKTNNTVISDGVDKMNKLISKEPVKSE